MVSRRRRHRVLGLWLARRVLEGLLDVQADLGQVHVQLVHDVQRAAHVQVDQREQRMPGPDLLVAELPGDCPGALEDLLGPARERQPPGHGPAAAADRPRGHRLDLQRRRIDPRLEITDGLLDRSLQLDYIERGGGNAG